MVMDKMIKRAAFILCILLIAASPNVVYVKSLKAKVMKEPSFKGAPLFTAEKGQKLSVVQKKGRWFNVSLDGKSGWVSSLLVGNQPPIEKVRIITGAGQDLSKDARRRASVATSAAAARGLTEDDRRRLGQKDAVNYHALNDVEAIVITESELAEFIEKTY
jgi:uncharacterized protein YgiM (DUF1202 family)